MEKRWFEEQPPVVPQAPPSYEAIHQTGYAPYANVGTYANYPVPPPQGGPYPSYENINVAASPPLQGHGYPPAQQTVFIQSPSFFESPVETLCPACSSHIRTTVESEAGPGAYITALIIASFGFFCGCCLIPFGIESMKVYRHKCPSCKYLLARHAGSSSCGSNAVYLPSAPIRH